MGVWIVQDRPQENANISLGGFRSGEVNGGVMDGVSVGWVGREWVVTVRGERRKTSDHGGSAMQKTSRVDGRELVGRPALGSAGLRIARVRAANTTGREKLVM